MFSKTNHSILLRVSGILLALMLLLAACGAPAEVPAHAPEGDSADPVAVSAPAHEQADDAGQGTGAVTVDLNGVAQDVTSQVIAAVPSSADGPWWEAMPQHTLLTLQGYPLSDHLLQAQIFVYPVEELGTNEVAGQVLASLQALLQSQQSGERMPYLPLYNAAQVLHAQVTYLDFKNGRGVRYLTQFDQAPLPVNNHELHYTFQGLTSDGRYYVAVVLPVSLPDLPATEYPSDTPPGMMEDFPAYLAGTVDLLNGQPASAFTPDLSLLDAMIGSLEIK